MGDYTICDGTILCPFVDELPRGTDAVPIGVGTDGVVEYEIQILQGHHQMHRDLPPTVVWGYDGIVPGPTIRGSRALSLLVIS